MSEPQQRPKQNHKDQFPMPRFFVAPKLDERLKDMVAEISPTNVKREKRKTDMMRYAAYLRISSEEQVGNYSIDAQLRAIQTWVQAQDGQLVKVYTDEAQSGRTAARPGFQQMRQDARQHKFDALIVHKFDRFARNRTDALAIKSLLRYDYGIKVFSVTEPSEDSDGPIGALIEGIMECVAEWYSRNLAAEVSKGRHEKIRQGFHNNIAPFGYKREGKHLIPNEDEVPGVRLAFEAYATGHYSYSDVARLLNEHGYQTRTGRPFSRDTVREILRNEIYLGKVRYQQTRWNADGSRNFTAPVEVYDGKHPAIIDEELFNRCHQAREDRYGHHQPYQRYNPYVLRGLVYCYHCCSNPVEGADFPAWGKMRCHTRSDRPIAHYGCGTRAAGFPCTQPAVQAKVIDEQVRHILSTLKPPMNWRANLLRTISAVLGDQSLEQRLSEIRETIERMDFRWDNGFITDKEDFLAKRLKLQQELENLTPVEEELDLAADILEHFQARWDACGGDIEKQHQLVKLILERVYVEEDRVVALTLKSNYHIVLGHNAHEPTFVEVDPCVHAWAQRDVFHLSKLYSNYSETVFTITKEANTTYLRGLGK